MAQAKAIYTKVGVTPSQDPVLVFARGGIQLALSKNFPKGSRLFVNLRVFIED